MSDRTRTPRYVEHRDNAWWIVEQRPGTEVHLTDLAPNQRVACGDGETYYLLLTRTDARTEAEAISFASAAPAPMVAADWPAWALGGAQELREVVDTLNGCIDALEGRDGADVCTDLAVAVHRIDMVSEAVALALDVPSTLLEDHVE